MEYGPASRTRSLTSTKELEVSEGGSPSCSTNQNIVPIEDFKTPARKTRKSKLSRTPSGQQLSTSVEDIRNWFQQNDKRNEVANENRVEVHSCDTRHALNKDSQCTSQLSQTQWVTHDFERNSH